MAESGVTWAQRADDSIALNVPISQLQEKDLTASSGVSPENKQQLTWKRLKYSVSLRNWKKFESTFKTILHEQSGCLRPGHLTAVIGPSGAGKSTLLECLSGRRRLNISGDIFFSSEQKRSQTEKITVSFIGQKDHHIDSLTVIESLTYASILKNYLQAESYRQKNRRSVGDDSDYHSNVVDTVIKELNLDSCANNFVAKCSGGQLKRLSFGLELVSRPNYMLFDEPSSGLDSSSAYQCMELLKQLTLPRGGPHGLSRGMGIMVSVHQPSAKILSTFDNLYILSKDGQCLYNGPQHELLPTLSKFGLNCPQFHNPADYVIEIASGDYGMESIKALFDHHQKTWVARSWSENQTPPSREPVTMTTDRMTSQAFPVWLHICTLLSRTWKQTTREPLLSWLRLIQHVSIALVVAVMYKYYIGEPNGCFAELEAAIVAGPEDGDFFRSKAVTSENASMLFFAILFLVYANTMSSVLTFPLQIQVFLKERGNGWYGSGAYFLATMVADLPFQITIPIVFSCIAYPATGQYPDLWRFAFYCVINILTAVISQSVGVFFGILFVENMSAAVFMAPISLSPLFLMGGLFVSYNGLTFIMKPLAIISYIRYAFEGLILVIYGFDRCTEYIGRSNLSATSGFNLDPMSHLIQTMDKNGFTLNVSQSEFYAKIFDVNTSCVENILYTLEDIVNVHNIPNDTLTDLGEKLQASYMLSHWDLEDFDLWVNLSVLAFFVIFVRVSGYFLLLYKVNKKR